MPAARVTLDKSGTSFEAGRGETILAAASRHGLWLRSACGNGTCGTCKAPVVAGDVRHVSNAVALTPFERTQGIALLCCAHAAGDVHLDIGELDDPPAQERPPVPARVIGLERLCARVMGLTLRFPPGESPVFQPGQYVAIGWDDGRDRSFSIANAPRCDGSIDLQIGRVDGGGFTRHVFETMRLHDVVRVRGPFGGFGMRPGTRPVIFIAGGTGIAPIWSILETFDATPPAVPISIYWTNRGLDGFYMAGKLRALSGRHADVRYVPVVSDPGGTLDGRGGGVQDAVLEDSADLSTHDVYACGSPGMIDVLRDALTTHGLRADRFFADSFHLPMQIAPEAHLRPGATSL